MRYGMGKFKNGTLTKTLVIIENCRLGRLAFEKRIMFQKKGERSKIRLFPRVIIFCVKKFQNLGQTLSPHTFSKAVESKVR